VTVSDFTLSPSPLSAYINQQDITKNLSVREITMQLLDELVSALKPGMTELEAVDLAKEIFSGHGVSAVWHKSYIYFGINTLLTYRHKYVDTQILREEDIVYFDIAPLIDNIEGDIGRTITFGKNPIFEDLKQASESIFQEAHGFWKANNPTGIALYEHVYALTQKAGYEFILKGPGHLVGAFPHKRWPGGLDTYPYPVEPNLWILEVHIRHPEKPYGAFFEDILG